MVILTNNKNHPHYIGNHLTKEGQDRLIKALRFTTNSFVTQQPRLADVGELPIPKAVVLNTAEEKQRPALPVPPAIVTANTEEKQKAIEDTVVGPLPVPPAIVTALSEKREAECEGIGPLPLPPKF